jgi:cytochrome bd-type quinol oxidase subunit 2
VEIDNHNGLNLQWRLFRIANYLLVICVLSFTGILIYSLTMETGISGAQVFYYLLMMACAGVLLTNYCSNLYLLEKCYPDSGISSSYRILIGLSLFFSSIIIAFLTLTFAYLLHDVITEKNPADSYTTRRHVVTAAFGTILLISYYVTWQQVALRKTIQRNHRRVYNAFLESN